MLRLLAYGDREREALPRIEVWPDAKKSSRPTANRRAGRQNKKQQNTALAAGWNPLNRWGLILVGVAE
jgi:hypothetical protein